MLHPYLKDDTTNAANCNGALSPVLYKIITHSCASLWLPSVSYHHGKTLEVVHPFKQEKSWDEAFVIRRGFTCGGQCDRVTALLGQGKCYQ